MEEKPNRAELQKSGASEIAGANGSPGHKVNGHMASAPDKTVQELQQEVARLRAEVKQLNQNLMEIENILGLKRQGQLRTTAGLRQPSAGFRRQPAGNHAGPRSVQPPRAGNIPQEGRDSSQSHPVSSVFRSFSGQSAFQTRKSVFTPEEMNIGKYGTAILAAVCILAGCLLLSWAAWSVNQPWLQALVMLAAGIGTAGVGWMRIRSGHSGAASVVLAACGLGILYLYAIFLYVLWNVSIITVFLCIALWTAAVCYMGRAGQTAFFFYAAYLSDLAAALMASSILRTDPGIPDAAVLLGFPTAVYAATLFLAMRFNSAPPVQLRRLRNVSAVSGILIYSLLFLSVEMNLFTACAAIAAGGLILIFWPRYYRGSHRGTTAGIVYTGWLMVLFYISLDTFAGPFFSAVAAAAVLCLFFASLAASPNRELAAAWCLWPVLILLGRLSGRLLGTYYPAVYMVLSVYYFYLFHHPRRCGIISFSIAYGWMYLVLVISIIKGTAPLTAVTAILLLLFALAVPVRYIIMMKSGQEIWDRQHLFRFGLALLAAWLACFTWSAALPGPACILLAMVITVFYTGMAVWINRRTELLRNIFFRGMILLWVFAWAVTVRCASLGLPASLASALLFFLTGSLAVWYSLRQKETIPGQQKLRTYAALAMSTVSLWWFLLFLPIPYEILVSLLMLLAAIGLLALGFRADRKEIRSYALFLTLLCVVKMITADLAGASLIPRAAALAAGGVLCLMVSVLYSRAEKKEKADRDNAGEASGQSSHKEGL